MKGIKHLKLEVEKQDFIQDNILYCAKSLTDICISFIAMNVHVVESLFGFPDIVGVNIFDKAEKYGKFQSTDKSSQSALQLFCESYEDLVLNSLSIPGNHLCFNHFYDHIILFKHLCKLDISCNGIGDDHDILHHISHLTHLETLCLRNNCLSDDGIRKMTSPIRMLKNGPLELKYLDLSENTELSAKVVRYIKCFKELQLLDVSYTSMKKKTTIEELKVLNLTPASLPVNDKFSFKTLGWAKNIVTTWTENITKEPENTSQLGSYVNFYKKSKPKRIEDEINSPRFNGSKLIFVKSKNIQKVNSSSSSIKNAKSLNNLENDEDEAMKLLYGSTATQSQQKTLSELMDSW